MYSVVCDISKGESYFVGTNLFCEIMPLKVAIHLLHVRVTVDSLVRETVERVISFILRWLSTCEFSCAGSVSDSFCRVDTALTETVCEFLATVESRLADSFLSRGYGRDVFLSDNQRALEATS